MFKYVSDVSILSHNIIKEYIPEKDVAIDATLGNGYDCDFLSENFKKVYAFEIQKDACDKYVDKNNNVTIINESHAKIDSFVKEQINCVCYNLGYLPGGDKNITTLAESSLSSIKQSLELITKNGIVSIAIYRGHNEGKEEEDNGLTEIIIAKHRNGATGEVNLAFEKNFSRFTDLAPIGPDGSSAGVRDVRG